MEYLILKFPFKAVNVPVTDPVALNKEANGVKGWYINPARLHGVTNAIIMYRGQILDEYSIGKVITYDKEEKRCKFKLKPLKKSSLKGKMLSQYKTPNPASLLSEERLKELLEQ